MVFGSQTKPVQPRGAGAGDAVAGADRASRQTLRPLVHIKLAKTLTLPYLMELPKSLLTEVAGREFRAGGKPPPNGRVSLV